MNLKAICGQRMDSHVHTTRSDGKLSPEDMLIKCSSQRIQHLVIADHDMLPSNLFDQAAALGIRLRTGIELGCYRGEDPTRLIDPRPAPLHILGINFDHLSPKLTDRLQQLEQHRKSDTTLMKQKLVEAGFEVNDVDVLRNAKGQIPRQFHFSGAVVKNPNNAARLQQLSPNPQNYYVLIREILNGSISRQAVLSPGEAIEWIIEAGGVAGLAHPCHKSDGWPAPHEKGLKEFIEQHLPLGLSALECYSSHHMMGMIQPLLKLAADFNLAITAGSDFHGREGEIIGSIKYKDSLDYSEITLGMLNDKGQDIFLN